MARFVPILLVLSVCCACAAAQTAKAACPAKYRYQWMYQVDNPTPDRLKQMDGLVMKWMREDCGKVLTFGQGPALSSKSTTYGIAAPSPTVEFADYGAWSDWASLDDLKDCYVKGLKSGNSPNIRKFSKKASRVVFELMDCPTASNAPATVRYMFNYKMADFSPANCKRAVELQGKITSVLAPLRHSNGCDAFNNEPTAYGSNIPVTANYGGFLDFKSEKDMTDYLSSKDPKAQPARTELRGMAASTMRSAVVLPATSFKGEGAAKVAKERGYMP